MKPPLPPVTAGYVRPWVVVPGDTATLHASLPARTRVEVVRVACANAERRADGAWHGPAERIVAVAGAPQVELGPATAPLVPGAQLQAQCGPLPPWHELTLLFALQRHDRGHGGHVLSLLDDAGGGVVVELLAPPRGAATLVITAGGGSQVLQLPLPNGEWVLLAVEGGSAGDGPLRVRSAICRAHLPDGLPDAWTPTELAPGASLAPGSAPAPSRLHLGTLDAARPAADIRLDLVSVLARSVVAALAPAQLLAADTAPASTAPALAPWEARLVDAGAPACLLRASTGDGHRPIDLLGRSRLHEAQRPYTAVRGVRWDGRFQGPQAAPAHYTAMHFNSDTLLDAHWPPSLAWAVPADLPSGCYAFRLTAAEQGPAGEQDAARAEAEDATYASFFVSAATRPRHPVAVLLPTFSYLAYANSTEDTRGPVITAAPHTAEARLDSLHPAHGRPIYDRHADGQGVLWASSRRPLWSVSPGHRPWQFVADTWLLDWLGSLGQDFDIVTDHDLHRLGAEALRPYRAVITGHHPEYTSTPMWDGLWRWLNGGGRLMYLGGNGFYWRTACDEQAEAIEVRRAEDGTRPTIAPPGEYHCAFNGEFGGLWRRLGRPPQQIVGVGMAAQGFTRSAHFRLGPDAQEPAVGFVFDGLSGDTFGHAGWWGGGASGWEIDRAESDLGTPPGTWWLARSEGHAPDMLRTKEELLSYVPPFTDAKARSDMVLAPVGQGAVFAVGSMTWIGALHDAQGRGGTGTDVATITANVLQRFLQSAPLPRKPA